ncbi:MAG: GspE/PulE family protein [bacterium]
MRNNKFIDLLIESNLIPSNVLEKLIQSHGHGTVAMLEEIIDQKVLSKDKACEFWSESINVAYVNPCQTKVKREISSLLPESFARQQKVLLLYRFGDVVTVAMANPLDLKVINELEQKIGMSISPVFSLQREIEAAISINYQTKVTIEQYIKELKISSLDNDAYLTPQEKAEALSRSSGVVKLFDSIIYYALRERASDIHIEPKEDSMLVRFRVDGLMRDVLQLRIEIHQALVSRIKILAKMNIAERRRPQDGRIAFKIGVDQIDFRISSIPTIFGEKIVLRVLGLLFSRNIDNLESMYIAKRILKPLKEIIFNPNGVFFVTGPTGSGKTTTLYAIINKINSPDKNIITIEDPVEYRIPSITQIQVEPKIGLDFSHILRSILRQDPDVILIGEIRDAMTAKIASEAALTGHLVFSTLHTNTAIQAVTRLVEIGVEPYMVAPSLIGILSQRLVAKICDECKESYDPGKPILRKYFYEEGIRDVPFYRGRGCERCGNTGYFGRIPIHELTIVSEEMRYLVGKNARLDKLMKAAKKTGYRTMRYDGLKKVLTGYTTIDEIERVTVAEYS